jgi:hypothetical protein
MLKRIALTGLFVVAAAFLTAKPVSAEAKVVKTEVVKPIVGEGWPCAGGRC